MFGQCAEPGTQVQDFELAVTQIQAATGWAKGFVEQATLAHSRLQDLPQVRALHAETRLLDMHHISSIDQTLAEAGPNLTEEELLLFDESLAALFTPKRNEQHMHARGAVTKRIRDMISRPNGYPSVCSHFFRSKSSNSNSRKTSE